MAEKSIYVENVDAEVYEKDDEIYWVVTNEEIHKEKAARQQAENFLTLAKRQRPKSLKKHLSFEVQKWVRKTEASCIGVKAVITISDAVPNAEKELNDYISLFGERCLKMEEVINYVVEAGRGNPDKIRIVKGVWGRRTDTTIEVDDEIVIDMVCYVLGRRKARPTSNAITLPDGKKFTMQLPAKPKPELQAEELTVNGVINALSSSASCTVEIDGKGYTMALMPAGLNHSMSIENVRYRLAVSYITGEPISLMVKANVEYKNGIPQMHSLIFCDFSEEFNKHEAMQKIDLVLNDLSS